MATIAVFSTDHEVLHRTAYSYVLWGVAVVLFGVAILVWPSLSAAVFVALIGAALLVIGLILMYGSWRLHDVAGPVWWIALLPSTAVAVFGLVVVLAPATVATVMVVILGAIAVLGGIGDFVGAIALAKVVPWWWLRAIRGVLLVALGVWIVLTPVSGLVALGWLIGLWAIVVGAVSIVLGVRALRS